MSSAEEVITDVAAIERVEAPSAAGGAGGAGAGEKALPPRKERSKSRDMGKRMGGGQKGVWGNPGEILTTVPADENDPNYDSEAEDNAILVSSTGSPVKKAPAAVIDPDSLPDELTVNPPADVKKRVSEIIEEYLSSGDADEVLSSLHEVVGLEPYKYEVVKRAITLAMDKHDKERELVSRLISEVYLNGLTRAEIALGLRRVLLQANELQIDIPNAKSMLSIFVARAIVDEVVPPSFLEDPIVSEYASDIAAEAIKKLSINHGTARMEKSWGPGDGRPVEELKVAIDQLTKEYLLSRDLEEAARCVRELNVKHFHHEVVKRGITNALEEGGAANCEAMSSLLAYLSTQEVVSPEQLLKGFERFKLVLPDVALDIPNAASLFQTIAARAVSDGILPKTFDATTTPK